MIRMLEDMFERATPEWLDFGFGDAEYKRLFGNVSTQSGSRLLVRLLYVYVLYPLLIESCARLFGRHETPAPQADSDLPTVTLVIAAYNEESVIGPRIENALKMDYPAGKRKRTSGPLPGCQA